MQRRTFLKNSIMGNVMLQSSGPIIEYSHDIIQIGNEYVQRFVGFGVSQARLNETYDFLPANVRQHVIDLIFKDLPVNVLRLWAGPDFWTANTIVLDFKKSYIDSGMLTAIKTCSNPMLLLAPAVGRLNFIPAPQRYAQELAKAIAILRRQYGVPLSVTGVINEPDEWDMEDITSATLELRIALNNFGLNDVGIVAPELPSVDRRSGIPQISALRANKEAWNAIQGVGVHSYNMALTKAAQDLASGKELWVTESGWGMSGHSRTNEGNFDSMDAAIVAARLLADLNHGATHWIYFTGFSGVIGNPYTAKRTAELVTAGTNGEILIEERYSYIKAILSVFRFGTRFIKCSSKNHADMAWTYGKKPSVVVACGDSTDGARSFAIVNVSGIPSRSNARFDSASNAILSIYTGLPRQTYAVERYYKNSREKLYKESDRLGCVKLTIHPFELVVIKSKR